MTEIGGYLELDNFIHNEYYSELVALNTARNALVYLCKARGIKKLYIPYFLCNSVSDVCERENVACEFYNINQDFSPAFRGTLGNDEWLYVVNYFGQLSKDAVIALKAKFSNLILDNVQAFFQKPLDGIDTIYSCRKFFGVPDGAYLSTNTALGEKLDEDSSKERMKHILGRYEGIASDYYADFKANDSFLKDLPLRSMSKLTHNILGAIDYEKVMERRNENWGYLYAQLKSRNKLRLDATPAPYVYPFYCENGRKLKMKLIERKLYIPTLWPNVFEFVNCQIELDYAANILPLPCDQRYDSKAMQTIIDNLID